jgi:hypothetical protein
MGNNRVHFGRERGANRLESVRLFWNHDPPSPQAGHQPGVATVVTQPGVTPSSTSISITRFRPRLVLPQHVTSIAGCSNGWFVE